MRGGFGLDRYQCLFNQYQCLFNQYLDLVNLDYNPVSQYLYLEGEHERSTVVSFAVDFT